MISLSVAIRGRPSPLPPTPSHSLSLRRPTYVVILSGPSKILFSSPPPRYSSSVPKRSSVLGVGAAKKKTLHMSRGCRLYFPVARLPGRGKAEYGGLSLQSARLGYSTVISVRALTRSPTLRRISVSPPLPLPPPARTFAPSGFQRSKGGPLHGRQSGAKTGERGAVFSLLCRRPPALFPFSANLLFPQFLFMYFYDTGRPLLRQQPR